jgi:hypothetical protein
MNHPVLGDITVESAHGGGVAHISYDGDAIEIHVIPDELSFEATIEVAASVVRHLRQYDANAKEVAASELTEEYNNGWNEYKEVQEDGSLKSVSLPKLSKEEFGRKLKLKSINVTGDMIDLFYDNDNMFLGHGIVVNCMDGLTFTDTHAELFG